MHKKEFWILTNKCGNKLKHETEAEGPWPWASFSCLSLFPCLIVKIPNSFLCICWRRMFWASDHSLWEINLKSTLFKVVLCLKQCKVWRNYRKGLFHLNFALTHGFWTISQIWYITNIISSSKLAHYKHLVRYQYSYITNIGTLPTSVHYPH